MAEEARMKTAWLATAARQRNMAIPDIPTVSETCATLHSMFDFIDRPIHAAINFPEASSQRVRRFEWLAHCFAAPPHTNPFSRLEKLSESEAYELFR